MIFKTSHSANLRVNAKLLGFLVVPLFLSGSTVFCSELNSKNEVLPFKTEASEEEWRSFLVLDTRKLHVFWVDHAKQKLDSVHWTWRIGLVKKCGSFLQDAPNKNSTEWCYEVLDQALASKTLVIRAEAASTLGRIGRAELWGAKLYKRFSQELVGTKNFRNGKATFALQNFLYTAKRSQDHIIQKRAESLANNFPETKQYWKKINL